MLRRLRNSAKALGFIAIGFSKPERPRYFDRFTTWISQGKNAEMRWLERNLELREDPTRLLSGCRSIVCVAYPYPCQKSSTPDGFTVSRYSQPTEEDYHYRLRGLCGELERRIEERYPESRSRICVDSVPIMEKSFAYSSGLGFIGKNNMLIIPGYGSYLYLAEILTTAPLDFMAVQTEENQCGTCTLCINSCPTGALEKPFYLDASKCLSYLTIEDKEPTSLELGKRMNDCFFGCDRCQEVCPFNNHEGLTEVSLPPTDEFLEMKGEEFKERFGKTVLARAGLEKLKTNIRAVKA